MTSSAASTNEDVTQTVDYSGDWRAMEQVPKALMLLLLGLVFAVLIDPQPPSSIWKVTILVVAMMAFAVLVHYLFQLSSEASSEIVRVLVIAVIVGVLLAIFLRDPANFIRYRRSTGSVPIGGAGLMVAIVACGWLADSVLKHVRPPPPILRLTPGGLALKFPFLKQMQIPWDEIRDVRQSTHRWLFDKYPNEGATQIVVGKTFYDRTLHVTNTFKRGPNWKYMFVPEGDCIVITLHHDFFGVAPSVVREPIRARWLAYRDTPGTQPPSRAPPTVHGRWAFDGSLWQSVKFGAPALANAAVLIAGALR